MSVARQKLAAKIRRLQEKLARMDAIAAGQAPSPPKKKKKHSAKRKRAQVSREKFTAGMILAKARKVWEPKLRVMPYQDFLQTDYWKLIRQHLMLARGSKCQKCGDSGELHIHHLSYDRRGMEHTALHHLKILCAKHHREVHGIPNP